MRNSIFRLGLFLLSAYFLASCAASHSGYMVNSASLSSNNFHYVQTDAFASAKCTYFLGLGGVQHDALVGEAKQNLYYKTGLLDNQVLANVTVNWKTKFSWFGLVITSKCTVTADIVEFDSAQGVRRKNKIVQEDPVSNNNNNTENINSAPDTTPAPGTSLLVRELLPIEQLNNLGVRIKDIASTPLSVTALTTEEQEKFILLFKEYFRAFQVLPNKTLKTNNLVISIDELGSYYDAYLSLQ